jgi:hypothetical protein
MSYFQIGVLNEHLIVVFESGHIQVHITITQVTVGYNSSCNIS